MKWVQFTDSNDKGVWINSANVTRVEEHDTDMTRVYFTGAKDSLIYVKEPFETVANKLR
jgi:uncharacterized protein YgiM (DUF1202 family)